MSANTKFDRGKLRQNISLFYSDRSLFVFITSPLKAERSKFIHLAVYLHSKEICSRLFLVRYFRRQPYTCYGRPALARCFLKKTRRAGEACVSQGTHRRVKTYLRVHSKGSLSFFNEPIRKNKTDKTNSPFWRRRLILISNSDLTIFSYFLARRPSTAVTAPAFVHSVFCFTGGNGAYLRRNRYIDLAARVWRRNCLGRRSKTNSSAALMCGSGIPRSDFVFVFCVTEEQSRAKVKRKSPSPFRNGKLCHIVVYISCVQIASGASTSTFFMSGMQSSPLDQFTFDFSKTKRKSSKNC